MFVITKSWGEYSDWSTSNVCCCKTKERAVELVALLEELMVIQKKDSEEIKQNMELWTRINPNPILNPIPKQDQNKPFSKKQSQIFSDYNQSYMNQLNSLKLKSLNTLSSKFEIFKEEFKPDQYVEDYTISIEEVPEL